MNADTALNDNAATQCALLLHQFQATTLGEGNLITGSNVLAVMALTLANISPPGSCVIDPANGTRIPVGMSMVIRGGLSCGMVQDRVLSALESRQSNLYAHIHQTLARSKQQKDPISEMREMVESNKKITQPTILDQLKRGAIFNDRDLHDKLRLLLHPPHEMDADEITNAPVIYAGIGSEQCLSSAMNFAQRRRLLVHTSLSRQTGAKLLVHACEELVSGCAQRKGVGAGVKGEVIVTDPTSALDGMLANDLAAVWLERMLWITDYAVGPQIEITSVDAKQPQLPRIDYVFEEALEKMITRRLDYQQPQPDHFSYAVSANQCEWNAFLAQLESRFPGISATLRSLWASLLFGLVRMIEAAPSDERIKISIPQIDSFARLLAMRMVDTRAVILQEYRQKQVEILCSKFLLKLVEGPQTLRELIRRFDRIDASTCREVLERLTQLGLVKFRNKQWALNNSQPPHTLTIDASY